MQNLNAYNREQFEQKFKTTETYRMLNEKYDQVCFDKFIETVKQQPTPRQSLAGGYPTVVSAVPWYYLNFLDSTKLIVDLGCGMNFFKPYFSNLVGVGAEQGLRFYGDIHDFVDNDFYNGHKSVYDSVFSINALHFAPLQQLGDIAKKFSDMVKPKGRGFLAMNAMRMLERSTGFKKTLGDTSLDHWIREQFNNFPAKILVFDLDLSVQDAYMDGNIRIVFEK